MTMDFIPTGITINAMDGRCYTCGDPQRKGQVAFAAKAFEDFLGRVEICGRCIEKAAEHLGLMDAEIHERVKETNRRVRKENENLIEEIGAMVIAREAEALHQAREIDRLKVQAVKAKAGA